MVKRWFRAARGASAVCIFLCALTVGVSGIATVTSYKAMINTVLGGEHAYSGINFGVNGDRVYVAEGAAINVVNFGADYGVWNITEYYFHIEGTLNSYGSDNAAGSVGNAASPDQPATCITGTYNRDLPLEDWNGSSGGSSEDVTE